MTNSLSCQHPFLSSRILWDSVFLLKLKLIFIHAFISTLKYLFSLSVSHMEFRHTNRCRIPLPRLSIRICIGFIKGLTNILLFFYNQSELESSSYKLHYIPSGIISNINIYYSCRTTVFLTFGRRDKPLSLWSRKIIHRNLLCDRQTVDII